MPQTAAVALPETMKAWVCPRYGEPDVLELREVPLPRVKADTVLIRMQATTVSTADARIRAARFPRGFGLLGRLALGFTGPRQPVLGTDVSGIVAAVGSAVTGYKPGDEVVAFPGGALGCHAEYVAVRTGKPLARKPENLRHEEAVSLLFGGMTALDYLGKAGLKAGQSLLVIGATGAVGQALVQLASGQGVRVSAVCGPANRDLAGDLGAVEVFNHQQDDFHLSGQAYDAIADLTGRYNLGNCAASLNENGRFLVLAGPLSDQFVKKRGTKRQIAGPASEKPEYIAELMRLAAAGRLNPVIDTVFAFADLPKAHAKTDTGHKRGSVVVRGLG